MNNTKIEVTIDEKGDPTVEVVGYTGKGCKDLTKNIEAALGAVKETTEKPEFYKQEQKNVATTRR